MHVLNPSFLAVTVKFWLSDFWRNTVPLKVKTQTAFFRWFIPVVYAITSITNDINNASKNTTIYYVVRVR